MIEYTVANLIADLKRKRQSAPVFVAGHTCANCYGQVWGIDETESDVNGVAIGNSCGADDHPPHRPY